MRNFYPGDRNHSTVGSLLNFSKGSVFFFNFLPSLLFLCNKHIPIFFAWIHCQLGAYLVTRTENVITFHRKFDILQADYFLEEKEVSFLHQVNDVKCLLHCLNWISSILFIQCYLYSNSWLWKIQSEDFFPEHLLLSHLFINFAGLDEDHVQ